MKKSILLCLLFALCCLTTEAAKKITVKVFPETASIYVDGQIVGTGSYQLKFDKNNEFYVIKAEAPGYVTRTYRLRKDYQGSTVLYTLPEDEALQGTIGSEDGVDLANRWFDVTCRKGLKEDVIWKRLMNVCTSYFDNIEVRDKSAGWIKTSWSLLQLNEQIVRTRLEVRMSFTDEDVISYRARLTVQINEDSRNCKRERCFKSYDRVPRKFEAMIQELQTSVGGGE